MNEIRSTKMQIETFKESFIWQDIMDELLIWKKSFDIERNSIVDNAAESNPSTASVLLHMGDINGRVKTVDYLLRLPDVFLQILADKVIDDKLKTNGG